MFLKTKDLESDSGSHSILLYLQNNVLIALLSATLFFGSSNASTIQPVVDTERAVFYRSALPQLPQ